MKLWPREAIRGCRIKVNNLENRRRKQLRRLPHLRRFVFTTGSALDASMLNCCNVVLLRPEEISISERVIYTILRTSCVLTLQRELEELFVIL